MKTHGFFLTVSFLALAACGAGSSTAPAGPSASAPPAAPPPTSASSSGVITGFGSIIVNGVRHATGPRTVVAIEGLPETTGDDSRLRLGMRVRIRSTVTSGARSADRIEYDDDLRGVVMNVVPNADDPRFGSFTIAGQTVVVDANTAFDDDVGNNDGAPGIDIRDLAAGGSPLVVEVSGFPTETGVIATRIDRVIVAASDVGRPGVTGDEIEVKGFVDSVAADGSSIVVNGAVFLVAGAVFDAGIGPNQALVGVFVEVKADIDGAGNFVAVRVEREDDLDGAERENEFEIEGVLQSVDTIGDPDVIVVNGVVIRVRDASALAALVGNRIEIEGAFDASGVLVIARTSFEGENSVRIEDRVAAIGAADFTTRLGVPIAPTTVSRIEDDIGSDGDRLSPAAFLSRLAADNFIEARGRAESSNIIWTRIERRSRDDRDCRLRGPVTAGSIANPRFTILGVTIDTSGLPDSRFRDEDGAAIGAAQFFSALSAGAIVEARSDDAGVGCRAGALSTGVSGEVSFEDDDDVDANTPPEPGAPPAANNEVEGTVRNIDSVNRTFDVAGRRITVTANTLIDASIVERARGVELDADDLRFGDLSETLGQLLRDGDQVEVRVDSAGNAIRIEDDD